MGIDTTYRTDAAESMDNFLMEGDELRDALDKIAAINSLLGGNALTLKAVKKIIDKTATGKTIAIADIGCGNGDMLRTIADYARKKNIRLELTGIDANRFTVDYATRLSKDYPNIHYLNMDIFEDGFKALKYDIILCTLTLHHFTNEEILNIMQRFYDNASIAIIINDLHRSKSAYHLFKIVSRIFRLKKMPAEDGLTSILRGFKKNELEAYSKQLAFKKYSINWRWAYRYEWITYKI